MKFYDEIRKDLNELRSKKSNGERWGSEETDGNGFIKSGPKNDRAWAALLEWILGSEHEAIRRIRQHLRIRENTVEDSIAEIESTLTRLRQKVSELAEKAEYMYLETMQPIWDVPPSLGDIWFGHHEVRVECWYDQDRILVDGVLFGDPNSLNPHCRSLSILANILFDGAHGLDQRPIEERAFQYMRGDWLGFIRKNNSAFTPDAPVIRECLHDLFTGIHGIECQNRLKACLLLWTHRPEREFAVCDGAAWGRSFIFVREVIDALRDRAWMTENGVCIIGESGNEYSICPPGRLSGFTHRYTPQIAQDSEDEFTIRLMSSQNESTFICIHTSDSSSELPMGDILASAILMLRDDINSAEVVPTLRPHIFLK